MGWLFLPHVFASQLLRKRRHFMSAGTPGLCPSFGQLLTSFCPTFDQLFCDECNVKLTGFLDNQRARRKINR
ncbi:hypothetical protein ES703_85459 [subsurface metagenome]